jgi:hypothetical protein
MNNENSLLPDHDPREQFNRLAESLAEQVTPKPTPEEADKKFADQEGNALHRCCYEARELCQNHIHNDLNKTTSPKAEDLYERIVELQRYMLSLGVEL